jgi:amino acid transporter
MKQTIMPFVPMATIYVIASLFALWRREGGGLRRWGRMHLWLAGAIVAAVVIAYIEWSMPGPSPPLAGLIGTWLVYCLVVACVVGVVLGYLKERRRRFAENRAS